jgi:hypothetical protein
MRNFHFIFSRKIAKTKRNGLRLASRCEITKKKEAKRAHPTANHIHVRACLTHQTTSTYLYTLKHCSVGLGRGGQIIGTHGLSRKGGSGESEKGNGYRKGGRSKEKGKGKEETGKGNGKKRVGERKSSKGTGKERAVRGQGKWEVGREKVRGRGSRKRKQEGGRRMGERKGKRKGEKGKWEREVGKGKWERGSGKGNVGKEN